MHDLMADLRYAARALLVRRSFSAAAILTLAIGIGLTTSIFSVLNAVVLRPLPLRKGEQRLRHLAEPPGAARNRGELLD